MIPTKEPCPACRRVGFMGCTGCGACGWMYGRPLAESTPPPSFSRVLLTLLGIVAAGWVVMGLSGAGAFEDRRRDRDR